MSSTKNNRRHDRFPLNELLRVSWLDKDGRFFHLQARCIDASASGVLIELKDRLEPDSYVNVKAEKHGLIASARVRHTIQRGPKFQVGLEFRDGATWESLPQS